MNEPKKNIVLGIESSCDDTAAAVMVGNQILSNVTASQSIHEKYGGVVPELASRAHQQQIVPVVDAALKQAAVEPNEIAAIAYTRGPGLLGSLLVGSSFAKTMAQTLGIPAIPIHHMKAHVLAHFIGDANESPPPYPFICLTVSGGHTQILRVEGPSQFIILGETKDDAAGEAFDKAAKMLGLPYPGGPEIDRLAANGNPKFHSFTKPSVDGLNFSFSGLKTNILNYLEKNRRRDENFISKNLEDICASIQHTIIEMLIERLKEAADQEGLSHVALAGGVSANRELRKRLEEVATEKKWSTYIPPLKYCTDNGAMIAMAGVLAMENEEFGSLNMAATARWKMD